MSQTPDITFYFLQGSRAVRIGWLLEELNLPYKLVASPRAPNGLAPPEFKAQIGTMLGKSPAIRDRGLVIQESGAIAEYLCEMYDPSHCLIPTELPRRVKVREWMAAAEGTFMLHALAVLYARWQMPEPGKSDGTLAEMEKKLGVNVQKDLDWLEAELTAGTGRYLVGESLTAAAIMMLFGIQIILARKLGTGARRWPAIERWMGGLEASEVYRRAVDKTEHKL